MTREGAVRHAAELAAEGHDTRHLASEQTAYADEIARVTKLVWQDGLEIDEAVADVLGNRTEGGSQ